MGKLSIFNFITMNGFYKGPNEDISWHKHGGEESQYSEESMKSDSILLFGRVTYEMMVKFWPTPEAMKSFPETAKGMNQTEKIVFSKTLEKADWNNSRIVKGNIEEEVKNLKERSGKDIIILGSGTIVSQLTDARLIDEYQIMVDPVAIGSGTPIFDGIKNKLDLKITHTRTFSSGVVLRVYKAEK